MHVVTATLPFITAYVVPGLLADKHDRTLPPLEDVETIDEEVTNEELVSLICAKLTWSAR